MPKARKFAIKQIEADDTVPPVNRMHLAELYSIPEWIAPAYQVLMKRNLLSFTEDEVALLTAPVVLILAKSHIKLIDTLIGMAYVPPLVVKSASCSNLVHPQCEAVWKETWWTCVARHLLNPMQRPELGKMYEFLQSLSGLDYMTLGCRGATLDELRWHGGFDMETRIASKAIESITKIHSRDKVPYYSNGDEED